jgi:membrane associated rhomboid family serine protease
MEDFLQFRKMITPVIIKILFWIGVAVCVIGGLVYMIAMISSRAALAGVFGGLLFMFLGPVMVRIYCELLILFFRINDTLTEIRNVVLNMYYQAQQKPQ